MFRKSFFGLGRAAKKKLFILAFACCLIGLMSPNLHADLVVDQSQSVVSGPLPINPPIWQWVDPSNGISQSFIPSMDNVAGASVSLVSGSNATITVTVNLWDKAPWDSGNMLISGSTNTTLASTGSIVDIYWDHPAKVTPGQEYFLQIFTNPSVYEINIAESSATDYYPGGSLFLGSTAAEHILSEGSNWDLVFKEYADTTYADPPSQAVPEPCSMLLLGCGLVGVVGFRRKLKK